MEFRVLLILGVLAGVLSGCKESPPSGPASQPQPTAKPVVQQPLSQPSADAAKEPAAAPTAQPEPVREKAAVGMGEKGSGYGGGVVTTPIKALWSVQERLVLDQVHQALQLYKATDPNGKGPKSHEDFMEQIIRANNISLPQLPPGERYYFDPIKEELMVEKPAAP